MGQAGPGGGRALLDPDESEIGVRPFGPREGGPRAGGVPGLLPGVGQSSRVRFLSSYLPKARVSGHHPWPNG